VHVIQQPASCAWPLTIRSFVDGPAVSTAGYVKLLLPPRQSRGNSYWGLAGINRYPVIHTWSYKLVEVA